MQNTSKYNSLQPKSLPYNTRLKINQPRHYLEFYQTPSYAGLKSLQHFPAPIRLESNLNKLKLLLKAAINKDILYHNIFTKQFIWIPITPKMSTSITLEYNFKFVWLYLDAWNVSLVWIKTDLIRFCYETTTHVYIVCTVLLRECRGLMGRARPA